MSPPLFNETERSALAKLVRVVVSRADSSGTFLRACLGKERMEGGSTSKREVMRLSRKDAHEGGEVEERERSGCTVG